MVTPAEVGFAGQSVKCPAAASTRRWPPPARPTARAARASPTPTASASAGGALTVPVKTQIANHLARFGRFKDSDLIVVFGRKQRHLRAVRHLRRQGRADPGPGGGWPDHGDQAKNLLLQAQLAAQEAMKQAALELAGYVKDEILAKGGKYVAVWSTCRTSPTRPSAARAGAVRPVLTTLWRSSTSGCATGLTEPAGAAGRRQHGVPRRRHPGASTA
jgi:outer membrane lipase/esterase